MLAVIITCNWCKKDTRVPAEDITVIEHKTTSGYEFSRLFQAKCPRCNRNLNWHRPTKDAFSKAEQLLDHGAALDIIELTAADLHYFQKDLEKEDFLSDIADYECYNYN